MSQETNDQQQKFTENKRRKVLLFLSVIFYSLILYIIIGSALTKGISEKGFFARYWTLLFGSGTGLMLGALGFVFLGGIGIGACGMGFGLHLVGLSILGGIGGLGVGSFVHVVKNPGMYNIDYDFIILYILIGGVCGLIVTYILFKIIEKCMYTGESVEKTMEEEKTVTQGSQESTG